MNTLFPIPLPPRWLVYKSRAARTWLCVCAARDARHALKVARQMFQLPRDAYAIPEPAPHRISPILPIIPTPTTPTT